MAIRPFRDIGAKSVQNGIASRKWVMGLFKQVLGGLHFTGDVSQTTDGHVHFEGGGAGAGGDCDFPFKVTLEAGTTTNAMRISPGFVRAEVGGLIYPRFSGTPIGPTAPASAWALANFIGVRYLMLQVDYGLILTDTDSFRYYSSAAIEGTPTLSVVSSIPSDSLPTIDPLSLGVISSGRRHVTIATITGSSGSMEVAQSWGGHMHLPLTPELRLMPSIGA